MPVLAILGGRDVVIDQAETRKRLAAKAPGARILWLPEGRHALLGQTPAVQDFLLDG